MNQHFNLSRFGRLFGRHTAEHLPAYLMSAAVLGGGMLLIMGFLAYLNGSPPSLSTQGILLALFLLGAGSVFSSTVFAQFGEKNQAIAALVLPASHLEKFLVAWLYSLPIFLLVFIPVFYLVDAAVVYGSAGPGLAPPLFNMLAAPKQTISVFLLYTLVNATGLLGAIFFGKMHFIKTAFVVFALLAIAATVNFQVLKVLLGADLRLALPFTGVGLMEDQQFYHLDLPDAQTQGLGLVPLGAACLLWLAAYVRVTEKQI